MEDDNTFQQITIESDNRTAEDRRMRHKTKMDKHLGDYDNQKSVLVSFPYFYFSINNPNLYSFSRGMPFTTKCKSKTSRKRDRRRWMLNIRDWSKKWTNKGWSVSSLRRTRGCSRNSSLNLVWRTRWIWTHLKRGPMGTLLTECLIKNVDSISKR